MINIKGIENETADSLLLYVFDYPVFIVDNYSRKLIEHFENYDIAKEKYISLQKHIHSQLNNFSTYDFKEFHALIDEHVLAFLNIT